MVDINFTIVAQVINFVILLGILAKFAYKPLLKAMEDRRLRIIKDMDTAEHTRLDAEALKKEYGEQLANARKEASGIVDKANKIAQNTHGKGFGFKQHGREQRVTDIACAQPVSGQAGHTGEQQQHHSQMR